MHLTRLCLPLLERHSVDICTINQSSTSLIYVASDLAHFSIPRRSVYSASKAALVSFAEGVFEDVKAKNVKVHVVLPSLVNTPMLLTRMDVNPSGMIQPEDVADMIGYLCRLTSSTVCPLEVLLKCQRDPFSKDGETL